jgi:lysophospholipase L1-like esterase
MRFPFLLVAVFFLLPVRAAPADLLVKNGDKIAFLGDSITEQGWELPGGYVKLTVAGLQTLGVQITPIPAGIGGQTSRDMLARFATDIVAKKPDWVTISCGVNDVWHNPGGVPLDEYEKNVTSMVDQAQAAGIKVLIMTATVIGENPAEDNNKKLVAYNDFLHQLATQRHLPVAEENAAFQAAIKATPPLPGGAPLITIDGVHPNPDGAQIVASTLLAGFGATPAQVAQAAQAWTDMPGSAAARSWLGFGITDAITLRQYGALRTLARGKGASTQDYIDSLFLQAVADAVQTHHADPVLIHGVIEHEAQQAFEAKIANLTR